ncbi:unnamed protein product, partial [Laminaria digitata]
MPDAQKERLHRKYVIWCVVNGRPWSAISDVGLKLIIAEWDPAFAAATPHPDTLKKILVSMYHAAKEVVVGIIKTAHSENKERGYDGPFCSLQMDLTTVANVEYATASINLVRWGDTTPTRLSLAVRAFHGTH